jgi:hypothetical protein
MLSDFGIAKLLESEETTLTGTGVGVGTPEYMAPEQGLGRPVDARADVYALGVVLYELVTGRRPYQADTPMAVLFKHLSEPLPPPRRYAPDLPEAVERLLFKALAKDPQDRYADMAAFAQALEALLRLAAPAPAPFPAGEETVVQAPPAALPPLPRPPAAAAPSPLSRIRERGEGAGGREERAPRASPRFPGWSWALAGLPISPQNADRVEQLALARWGKGTVGEVACSPDGRLLAVASSVGIVLYDAGTLAEVRFIESDAWVWSVAFSPDGGTLASGSGDNTVRLWGVRP